MSPRGLRAWCHALPRMRASSLPASPLPVCSRMGRAPRPRRASPGVIGALCRGRKRGNAVKGNVEYRSRAAARICRESPLTEWSATLAREGNGRPFPSATRRVRGLVRRGQRPLPAIGFWGCRPAALFFQKGRRGLGMGFPWARYYDLAHGNPISDTDTSGWFGVVRSLFFANYVRKIM